MNKVTTIFAAAAIFAVVGLAHAATVEYTVSGWGPTQFPGPLTPPDDAPWGPNGYPGDKIELQTYTGSLDLTPGTSEQKINTLLWTIDYTYGGAPEPWPDMLLSSGTPRGISFAAGPTGTLDQTVRLRVNYYIDYLALDGESTKSFIVQGYKVDVTPLALTEVGGSNFDGNNPWTQPSRDVTAQFVVTAIPEPGTLVLLATGGLSALATTWIRRRRAKR